jgi:hypothetical protein
MRDKAPYASYFWICLTLLLVPYLLWFVAGENSFVIVPDNLDSEFVYIQLLLESGNLFGFDLSGEIPQVMNGIPRTMFRSGFNLTFLFFSVLPPFYAYVSHHLVVHLIGFLGMFWLLQRYFKPTNDWLVPVVALCFGLLPYYHIQYGISIAGQPLLLFAFLNILNGRQKWHDWLIIAGFPFFSFLVVTLPFFVPILVLLAFLRYRKTKAIPYKFLLAIFVLCAVNVLVEFNLIYSTFLSHDIVTHRSEWNRLEIIGYPNFKLFLYYVFVDLQHTHYHAGTFYTLPVLFGLLAAKLFFKVKISREMILVALLLAFVIFWDAFNGTLLYLIRDRLAFVERFSTERFFFLAPLLWLLLLVMVFRELNMARRLQQVFVGLVLVVTFAGIVACNKEIVGNFKRYVLNDQSEPSFRQFYAKDLFAEIKQYIGPADVAQFSTLSVLMMPAVVQSSGFKTLDSYQNNYELSYKHEFREIIAPELAKSKVLTSVFDNMGSACYAYAAEITTGFIQKKDNGAAIQHLDYNFAKAKAMGCKYVLSALPIVNHETAGLRFHKSFENADSFYEIFLYEIL